MSPIVQPSGRSRSWWTMPGLAFVVRGRGMWNKLFPLRMVGATLVKKAAQ